MIKDREGVTHVSSGALDAALHPELLEQIRMTALAVLEVEDPSPTRTPPARRQGATAVTVEHTSLASALAGVRKREQQRQAFNSSGANR